MKMDRESRILPDCRLSDVMWCCCWVMSLSGSAARIASTVHGPGLECNSHTRRARHKTNDKQLFVRNVPAAASASATIGPIFVCCRPHRLICCNVGQTRFIIASQCIWVFQLFLAYCQQLTI